MRTFMSIDAGDARLFMNLIMKTAENDGLPPVAVSIVDITYRQLLAAAMDDVALTCVQTAHDKAVTALAQQTDTVAILHVDTPNGWVLEEDLLGGPTDVSLISHGPSDAGLRLGSERSERESWSLPDLIGGSKINKVFAPWAGGVLIRSPHDDSILGAVGVSGRLQLDDHRLASLRPSGWSV